MNDNNSRKFVLGVDPGLAGGLAFIEIGSIGEAIGVGAIAMPVKPGPVGRRDVDGAEVGAYINHVQSEGRILTAVVESVHAMPKQGVSSSFNFGKGYGKILGIIESFEIPLDEPSPQRWQKLLQMRASSGKSVKHEKNDSIRFVLNHFPTINLRATQKSTKLHDGMAEAICLAEYARRSMLQVTGGRLAVAGAP